MFGGDKAEGTGAHTRRQKAEERKDFRQKGGYQGGFGLKSEVWAVLETTSAIINSVK